MKDIKKSSSIFLVALVVSIVPLGAQSFRGHVVPLPFPEPDQPSETTLRSGDVAVVAIPGDRRFIAGVDIRVLPQRDSGIQPGMFTVVIYDAVDAPGGDGIVTLGGMQKERIPVTAASPISAVVTFAGSPRQSVPAGTALISDVDPSIGNVGIQLVPAAKGMSQEHLDTTFTLQLTPILRPKGGVIVRFDGEDEVVSEAELIAEVYLDDVRITPGEIAEFTPGIYRLRAEAGNLLTHTANIGIERGRIRTVTLTVVRPRATVHINVPTVAQVFWNGELISRSEMSVEPGEHTLLIRLGDFTISRKITLEPNGDYQLGVDLDILFKQN